MYKILFVCHGNICRSPMAEYIMKDIVSKNNKFDEFLIDSCATSTEELGSDLYYETKNILDRYNIKYNKHYARQININDYNKYDLILCMDKNNLEWLDKHYNVKLLGEYSEDITEIEDPWYTRNFDKVYNQIYKCCDALYNDLIRK